ncbi:MAG: divergent polysaccharide deacetylase family protein [Pseudomonadota bacterium]
MARGFLSGVLWGGVVSVAGAAALSIAGQPPVSPAAEVEAPQAVDAPQPGTGETPQAGADADLVMDGDAPQLESPEADDASAVEAAGADTPTVPQAGQADDLAVPAEAGEGASVTVDSTAPVQPDVQTDAPQAPAGETELSISTDPAQPPAPDVPQAPTAFAEEAPDVPAGTDTPTAEAPAPDAPSSAPAPEAPAVADAPVDPEPAPERTATLPSALDPTLDTGGPTIGRPATSLVDRNPAPEAQVDEAAPADADVADDTPPFTAYAAPFENPDDKPLMSIVLIDEGADLTGGTVGLAALQSFPYPLSFAVNAALPDAAERAAEYRARGFEVAALLDLPAGATATDAEVNVAAAIDAVPEAVAVMEGTGSGVQETRDASDQVTAVVRDSGHGLILQSKGLNTAQKLAARDGVPAGLIFRDFDSAGQTPTVIRRFLDQAAFRAGQEGGVIMVGRVRPDTISALLLWGLQDRAERVALAPVSAVLQVLADDTQ